MPPEACPPAALCLETPPDRDPRRVYRTCIGPGRQAAPGPASRGRDRNGQALAGRDAEIRVLREAWARAAAGEPSLVVITGEAGIGKTALAAQLEAEAGQDGATVLRTRCYEAEQSLFLQPFVDAVTPAVSRMTGAALRDLLGEHAPALAELLPDAAAVLGPPPSWRGSPEMERRRSFEAVTAFLSGLVRRTPVLLVVDDLQYAGKSTVEFTHYLSRHLSGGRLLVVVTVRAEDREQAGAVLAPVATRVELGPLGPAAVAQLAREAGQEGLAETILRRTRGHTLFVVEVVRALAAGEAGVPESLLSAVQARVRRTGAAAESLLRAAAVLGAAFDPLVLAELLGLAPAAVLDLCDQALQARLLIVSGRDYEFANDLIREVMYASTPEPARLAHHRRAADLLTSQPEVLARHASAAGDWPRAGRAWALAAEDAMRRYATSDAIALSAQVLCWPPNAAETRSCASGPWCCAAARRRRPERTMPRSMTSRAASRPHARSAIPGCSCARSASSAGPGRGWSGQTPSRPSPSQKVRRSTTTWPTWPAGCGSPSRSATGQARRTCCPKWRSCPPTGCGWWTRLTTARAR